jgi:hypothetical protein
MNSKYLLIRKLLRTESFLKWAERNGFYAHSATIEKIVNEIREEGDNPYIYKPKSKLNFATPRDWNKFVEEKNNE